MFNKFYKSNHRNLKSWISVIWLYVSRPRVLSFSRINPDYFPPPQITEHGQIRNLETGARQYWGGVVCKTPSRAFHFSIRNFRKTTYAHGTFHPVLSFIYKIAIRGQFNFIYFVHWWTNGHEMEYQNFNTIDWKKREITKTSMLLFERVTIK